MVSKAIAIISMLDLRHVRRRGKPSPTHSMNVVENLSSKRFCVLCCVVLCFVVFVSALCCVVFVSAL
jgi:hypothetical protein